jgi:hypothetical protein
MTADLQRMIEGFVIELALVELGTIRAALDALPTASSGLETGLLAARLAALEGKARQLCDMIARAAAAEAEGPPPLFQRRRA